MMRDDTSRLDALMNFALYWMYEDAYRCAAKLRRSDLSFETARATILAIATASYPDRPLDSPVLEPFSDGIEHAYAGRPAWTESEAAWDIPTYIENLDKATLESLAAALASMPPDEDSTN